MQPSAIDLTTLASVKAFIPVSGNSDDALLQSFITGASRDWIRRTGRGPKNWQLATLSPFNQPVPYTETYDGNGRARMFLRNAPIVSVQSLVINGVTIPQSTAFGQAGWVVDDSGKSISLRDGSGGRGTFATTDWIGFGLGFTKGLQNIVIQYTAGFDTPVMNELQSVPGAGPFTLQAQQQWMAGLSVNYFSTGAPLTAVLTAPALGQYFIQSPGVYLFSAADAGAQVLLNYLAAGTPPDIQVAINENVTLMYKQRPNIGVRSQAGQAGGQTTYDKVPMSPHALRVLKDYQRTAMV